MESLEILYLGGAISAFVLFAVVLAFASITSGKRPD